MRKRVAAFDDAHFEGFLIVLGAIPQFDLMILKTHAVIEHLLCNLLADRMRIDAEQIPASLSFRRLAELSLAGLHQETFLRVLDLFSSLRNEVAHSAKTAQTSPSVETFVKHVQAWAREHRDRLRYIESLEKEGWLEDPIIDEGVLAIKSIRGAIVTVFFHLFAIRQHFHKLKNAPVEEI